MGLNFEDSLQKFHHVLRLCEELDVHIKPVKINGNVWIVPLFAWYTPEFDKKWDGEFAYRVRTYSSSVRSSLCSFPCLETMARLPGVPLARLSKAGAWRHIRALPGHEQGRFGKDVRCAGCNVLALRSSVRVAAQPPVPASQVYDPDLRR